MNLVLKPERFTTICVAVTRPGARYSIERMVLTPLRLSR